jgi:hypothetical protein
VDGAQGLLWLRNQYGDVTIREAVEATLDAELRDGAFTFEGQLSGQAAHRLDVERGDVTLRLPPDTALWLDAQAQRGRIDGDLSAAVERAPGQQEQGDTDEMRLEGALNGGQTKLRIKVRDGDITVESN